MQGAKKKEKTALLDRGVNIDPPDIRRPRILEQAMETMETQDLEEKIAEDETLITGYSLIEESGEEASSQQQPI
jgi:hypothetical protein